MGNRISADDLVERLQKRAAKVRGYIASSERVMELLKPEMDKFEARTGHDIYTVRLSVDHQSSVRTQTKEAEELEQAAQRIIDMGAELGALRGAISWSSDFDPKLTDRIMQYAELLNPAAITKGGE